MVHALGVVQVHRHAGGLPEKLIRKLGGMSLLELVVRRATDCERLDGVIVLADDELHEAISPFVPSDVAVVATGNKDSLAALVAALDEFRPDSAVCFDAHNPYLDPVLVDRLVSSADAHPHCDYISYRCADGRPAILARQGFVAQWCRADALRRAHREARRPADRQSATFYLYSHPEQFSVRLLPLPAELDRHDLRLCIDFEEDWEHAHTIYEALGTSDWDWQHITDFLVHQPALRRRMAHLNRVTAQV